MGFARLVAGVAAVLVVGSLAGGQVSSAGQAASAKAARMQEWASTGHPRLMLDGGLIRAWQAGPPAGKEAAYRQLLRQAESLKRAKVPESGRFDRGHGNTMAALAVTARLTGDGELAAVANRYLLDVCRHEVWDPDADLLHGHMLWGAAIAYDWLFDDLSDSERAQVREALSREAQRQYVASGEGRGYWRTQYLQNHGHVNLCGLAFAAAAVYGEDERADAWLAMADDYFTQVFRWSNPDGTSIEGLSYGMYALEFCLRYAELARQLYGRNHFGIGWFAQAPQYVLHSTLPVMTQREWAMTFGDSPRAATSHLPTHSLAKIAAENDDPVAQGASRLLQDLHGTLGRDSWQTLLWMDPAQEARRREDLPTFHHFADTGQVMMRTDWGGDALMVGLKCGPWLGHNLWGHAQWDYGIAHGHPDVNSFQIFANGQWLLIDPGYTYLKRTSNHSTLLIDGAGQLGEGGEWFVAEDAAAHDHYAKIMRAESREAYDYAAGDGTHAYHPGLGLRRFVRHWLMIKPLRAVVLVDDLAAEPTGYCKAWTRWAVQSEAMKVENPQREFLAPSREDRRGRVWFEHDGPDGVFHIDVDYFDNWPGEGRYVLAVNDRVVEEWVHDVQETDLHVRIVRDVELRRGDRVELRGEPFGRPGRFIKMVVWSRTAPRETPHEMELLLHAPTEATVQPAAAASQPGEDGGPVVQRYRIEAGQGWLDVWAAAEGLTGDVQEHQVLRPSQIRQTRRIALRPVLRRSRGEDAAVVVTVLQAGEGEDGPALRQVISAPRWEDRSVVVRLEDARGTWEARVWLEDARATLTRLAAP